MVIAIISPETEVHLVEPLGKRARLLREIAAELRLPNVTVHGNRAEEAGRGPLRDACQVAVARAVAEARELVEYLAPLVAPGGLVVMPKGSRASDELKAAKRAMTELGCEFVSLTPMRPAISETALVAVLRKLRPTPEEYPRRAGVPHRRPL
jgi:16S rRNA (guanine527-N7)-methyltransferase